jgi:iron complex outermembrane recepter protein
MLRFSALGTVNLRLFADLGRLPAMHDKQRAQGARIALQVLNVADRRQSVLDSSGVTPLAFAPGYLDPAGRTVWLTLRKAF